MVFHVSFFILLNVFLWNTKIRRKKDYLTGTKTFVGEKLRIFVSSCSVKLCSISVSVAIVGVVTTFPFVITMQRYEVFPYAPNFAPSIHPIFSTKSTKLMFSTSSLLTLGRVHASMALHSLNRSLKRTVISWPRIRNFRPSKVTFGTRNGEMGRLRWKSES